MIKFTVTEGALDNPPVHIDGVVLCGDSVEIKTITDFSGNSVRDESGVGDYVVISFIDNTDANYTIDQIKLKSGSTVIATSEEVNIVKPLNQILNMRITAQFDGAYKCYFSNTTIGLPYATNFRQGVVRLAKLQDEQNPANTVYSAQDTVSKIEEYISGTDQYVPWDLNASDEPVPGELTFAQAIIVDDYNTPTDSLVIQLNGHSSGNVPYLQIAGYITGTAVSSSPTISSGSITDTDILLNGSYISALYSNEVDVATTETAAAQKLVTSHAVRSYVESKISDLNSVFVHLTGAESISGAKTFADGVVSTSYTGTGVQSSTTNWNASANYAKLTTVEVVDSALTSLSSDITTAYQTADSGLQSQIDAINAGQNLADIVDTKSDLETLDAQYIDENDKVQVLHDDTLPDGTQGTTAVSTVYSLTEGSSPYPDPRDIAAYNKAGYYWEYIGEYGSDSYTKSESDSLFVAKASLDQTIASTSSTTNAPSTLAVYNSLSSLGSGYVKLYSASEQTINSSLNITQQTKICGITVTKPFNDQEIIGDYFTYCKLYVKYTTDYVRYGAMNSSSKFVTYMQCATNTNVPYIDFRVLESSALKLLPILSGSTITGFDVSGNAVANYSAITPTPPASVTDGRLTTVDYVKSLVPSTTNFAQLDASNTFTGTTNTFAGVSATSYTGTGVYDTYSSSSWSTATTELPTVSSVKSAITDASPTILSGISIENTVGSIGLFLYTEVDSSTGIGAQKVYGETVSGAYLKPVGMSLPASGQISYKAVATTNALSGTWKLLSVALKRTSSEPCLVLAQKISNT